MEAGNATRRVIDWKSVEAILFSKIDTELMEHKVYTEICNVIGFGGLDLLKTMFEDFINGAATRAEVRQRLKRYAYTFFGAGDIAEVMLLFDSNIENPNLRLEQVDRICVGIRKAAQCSDVVMEVIKSVKNKSMTYSQGAAHLQLTMELLESDPLGT